MSRFYIEDGLGQQTRQKVLLGVEEFSIDLWDVPMADIVRAGSAGRGIMFFDVDREACGVPLFRATKLTQIQITADRVLWPHKRSRNSERKARPPTSSVSGDGDVGPRHSTQATGPPSEGQALQPLDALER
jgi:hypothetical protein